MTTKGLKNVLTMDRVEFGEAWINAKETRLPDFLVAVRDAAVAAVRAEYEARTPTLDEATVADDGDGVMVECIRDAAKLVREGRDPDGIWLTTLEAHAITRNADATCLARAYLERHDGVKVLAEEVARRAMVESQLRKEVEALRALDPETP